MSDTREAPTSSVTEPISERESRAARKDEDQPQPPRRRVRWRLALLALALVLLAGSPFWVPLSLGTLSFFRVRNVEIVGARYVPARDILNRLRVDTLASVWDPTAPLERRVATHPQVRSVEIERKLPGTLVVHIDERLPVALVPSPRGFRAFDERGVALPIDLAKTPIDAPILIERDTSALRLLAELKADAPMLYDHVSDVRPVSDEELLIALDSVTVRAMKSMSAHRLFEIQPVRDDLARRQLKVVELDLRYRDQVIARIQ